ncbi:unnamed protein product [Cylicocyclus nassatus]|uniref:Uncharacterized protein n=1 Tax=Cylicocyclus nassatus TaxID=53992 RepID=A0AA36M908_CYLNA|nr:unnamed protein product [Cylicocyclus nassatus]
MFYESVVIVLLLGSGYGNSQSVRRTTPLARLRFVHPTTELPKVWAGQIFTEMLNSSYDKRIRPPHRDERGKNIPVDVYVNFYVRSISNINFVKMEYDLQITFRQHWSDPRLAYRSTFRGRHVPRYLIITDKDSIWTPDTFFLNEKRAHRHDIDKLNLMIRIYSNGTVMYSERISLTLSCPMYLQNYPMDEQICQLDLASYAFTTDDIVYHWHTPEPIQFHPMLNTSLPCFTIDQAYTTTCTSITTTGEYSCIRMVFHLKRLFSYYMAQIYIPSSLLVIVSWVSFWLERTAVPARVTLGVTTLLTMTTQAASINSSLPAVSYIKAVDVWIGVCLAFVFAAVLEFAWVSYQGNLYSPEHCQPAKSPTKLGKQRKEANHENIDKWESMKNEEEALCSDEPIQKKSLTWWQKWKKGADSAKMIDLRSRVIFPLLFLLFNVCYWPWCASR